MSSAKDFVIVGGGVAGAKAAGALRSEGFTGRITLIGQEREAPYERPPLSKGFLQGTQPRDGVFVDPAGWYDSQDVDLRLGVGVSRVDRAARRVILADDTRVPYDALLLATGSRPRQLSVPGADLPGVHHLRTLDDAEALKAGLAGARRVVIVGGGWIGLEVAAAAASADLEVTILEQGHMPLERVLGPTVAGVFADLHRAHGVDLRCSVTISRLISAGGRLAGVELDDGTLVEADLAVVGIGITPNTGIAEAAGLVVENGILVDEHLRTSDPDIYAAGDVANAYHPTLRQHVRVEHAANAERQGPVAARSMLGQDASDPRLPFFYTDQYDLGMEYTGYVQTPADARVVLRGDVANLRFVALWVVGGRVAAGMHVNEWDATPQIEALILSGRQLDPGRLADPDIAITDL